MREWPKGISAGGSYCPNYPQPCACTGACRVEVIPADLGRELYEALKEAEWGIDRDHPADRIDAALDQAQKTLAHYERVMVGRDDSYKPGRGF